MISIARIFHERILIELVSLYDTQSVLVFILIDDKEFSVRLLILSDLSELYL